jgi:hypothetical protein
LRLREDQFACDEHGTQTPTYNYVMNVYLDDGTGNIRAIFWKQQSQRLLKLNDNEFNAIRIAPEMFEKYKTDMLGVQIKVLGTVKNSIMNRLELNAEIVFTDLNPDHEIEALDHMREVALEVRPITSNGSSSTTEDVHAKNSAERSKQIAQAIKPEGDDEFEISEDFLE